LPAFNPPPQARFAEIAARPVFSPLRKPFPQTDLANVQNTAPPQVKLIGVIISAQKSLAILKGANSGAASSVAVGQVFEGWQVSRIDPGQVVFHSAQGDYAIPLHPPRTGAARAPAKSPGPGGDPL
jgi:type II secretory pathway component PulC